MPKERRVDLAEGEVVRVFAASGLKGGINKSGLSATLTAKGTYVEPDTPTPPPDPPVPPIVIPDKVVPVTNLADLRKFAADNTVDKVLAKDGRYLANQGTGAGSLWIGSQASGGTPFAERTKPVLIQAENRHKAILEGGLLSFEDGAHDMIWDGFRHSNTTVSSNGIINFGGYYARRPPERITVRNLWIDETCKAAHGPSASQDHAIYTAHALGDGPGWITVEDFRIDAANLNGAIHSWHPEAGQDGLPCHDVIFRRGLITKPWWGLVGGHLTVLQRWLLEDIRIEDARNAAIAWYELKRVEMTLRNVVSVRSATPFEFNGSKGPIPPGVPGMVFEGSCSFA